MSFRAFHQSSGVISVSPSNRKYVFTGNVLWLPTIARLKRLRQSITSSENLMPMAISPRSPPTCIDIAPSFWITIRNGAFDMNFWPPLRRISCFTDMTSTVEILQSQCPLGVS